MFILDIYHSPFFVKWANPQVQTFTWIHLRDGAEDTRRRCVPAQVSQRWIFKQTGVLLIIIKLNWNVMYHRVRNRWHVDHFGGSHAYGE